MPFHHVAFAADDIDALELDHGWCRSVSVNDSAFVAVPPLGPAPGVMVYEAERAG